MSEDEVIRTDISIDDALKMIISAGKVSTKEIADKFGRKQADIVELEKIIEAQMKEQNKDSILQ